MRWSPSASFWEESSKPKSTKFQTHRHMHMSHDNRQGTPNHPWTLPHVISVFRLTQRRCRKKTRLASQKRPITTYQNKPIIKRQVSHFSIFYLLTYGETQDYKAHQMSSSSSFNSFFFHFISHFKITYLQSQILSEDSQNIFF